MSPLANRPVAKMNGIGNEIAVLDLRGTGSTVSGAKHARFSAARASRSISSWWCMSHAHTAPMPS